MAYTVALIYSVDSKFVTLLRCDAKNVEYSATKIIIIPFSKNAGHLSHFAGRGTSDENAGLSSECGTVDTYGLGILVFWPSNVTSKLAAL